MSQRDLRADQALALLRVVAGIVFMAHGYQKFFVTGVSGVSKWFGSLGAPLPGLAGPGVATLELVGGAALVAGVFARPIALLLVCDMIASIVLVHGHNGFFVPTGIEFVMTLGTAAAAIALAGPGLYSVDRALAERRRKSP